MEAQRSRNIPGVRPSPNTPSDVSCSSGPCSVVSTRETSPASSTHYPLEASSAARELFTSCPEHAVAIPYPGPDQSRPPRDLCRPRPGLEATIPSSPVEMNPNPSQSASGGPRSKFAAEDPRASHTSSGATTDEGNFRHRFPNQQFRQVLVPTPSHHPSSIPPASTPIHRGLQPQTWRSSTASLDSQPSSPPIINTLSDLCPSPVLLDPIGDFATFATPSSSPFPYHELSNFVTGSHHSFVDPQTYVPAADLGCSTPSSSTHNRQRHPLEHRFDSATVDMQPQSGKLIPDSSMDRAMSYCYSRGNGQYTRLVPVDMLPVEIVNIPRRVDGHEGMIVLPIPRQPGADGQPANNQLEQQRVATPPSSPNGNGNGNATTDIIQSRIDSIISASPGPGSVVLAARGFDGSTPTRALTLHHTGNGVGGSARREKVYCDKWIHDGTCAFTQQGCKYKHEMPADPETQQRLGLFHGFPSWWKKQQNAEAQRNAAAAPLAIEDRPVGLSSAPGGRPPLFPGITQSTSAGSGLSNAVVSSNWRTGAGPAGSGLAGVSRSPSSPTPLGNNGVPRGSVGFGAGSRGPGRQGRLFTSYTPPSYGPIGPPSRAGASGSTSASATAAPVPTTRNTRSMTTSSVASSGDITGGGAPYGGPQRSAFESGNPFAPLGELVQHARATPVVRREDTESSSGDNTAAEGEQRGAPL